MISLAQLKKGHIIMHKTQPYLVAESSHHKMGRAGAVLKTKLKNLKTGNVIENTFQGNDKIELANLSHKRAQFLYTDEQDGYFMDDKYEQIFMPKDNIQNELKYLKEAQKVDIQYLDNNPINIQLPPKVDLRVAEAAPAVKGDTYGGGCSDSESFGTITYAPPAPDTLVLISNRVPPEYQDDIEISWNSIPVATHYNIQLSYNQGNYRSAERIDSPATNKPIDYSAVIDDGLATAPLTLLLAKVQSCIDSDSGAVCSSYSSVLTVQYVDHCGNGTVQTDKGEQCDPVDPAVAGKSLCTATCTWEGDIDGDGQTGQTADVDCDNNDNRAYVGSTNKSTVPKDMNCINGIEEEGPTCVDPRTGDVDTTEADCNNMGVAQGKCSSAYPGSTVIGGPNCYIQNWFDPPRYINSCSWCAQESMLYY